MKRESWPCHEHCQQLTSIYIQLNQSPSIELLNDELFLLVHILIAPRHHVHLSWMEMLSFSQHHHTGDDFIYAPSDAWKRQSKYTQCKLVRKRGRYSKNENIYIDSFESLSKTMKKKNYRPSPKQGWKRMKLLWKRWNRLANNSDSSITSVYIFYWTFSHSTCTNLSLLVVLLWAIFGSVT